MAIEVSLHKEYSSVVCGGPFMACDDKLPNTQKYSPGVTPGMGRIIHVAAHWVVYENGSSANLVGPRVRSLLGA